jgi:hypothetical protein
LPLEGALVEFIDEASREYSTTTNCAGNFYVELDAWEPRFPVWVQVSFGDESILMETPIQRDGACGSCHADPAAPDSTGHVFVFEQPQAGLPGGCR